MVNYFSKFSIDGIEQETLNLNLMNYRKYAGILSMLLYLVIFIVFAINLPNPSTNLIVKGVLFILGFGLHVTLQFNFSKRLQSEKGQPTKKEQLLSVLKRYEPNMLILVLFFIVYLVGYRIPYVFIVQILLLIIALLLHYNMLKKDGAV